MKISHARKPPECRHSVQVCHGYELLGFFSPNITAAYLMEQYSSADESSLPCKDAKDKQVSRETILQRRKRVLGKSPTRKADSISKCKSFYEDAFQLLFTDCSLAASGLENKRRTQVLQAQRLAY